MSAELKQNEIALNVEKYILGMADDFNSTLHDSAMITFERECKFAKQQIMKSDYILGMARSNPQSLHNAIMNVAAIGISLNPANAHAYLVPRDGAIMLDVSYRGLCKLATDTGVIKWVQAKMVYAKDTYKNNGLILPPDHKFDDFSDDRGDFKGVYCVVKTNEGDFITNTMKAADIYKIRDTSKAYIKAVSKNKTNSVWHEWFDQMAIKTVIKRASKLWPVSDGTTGHVPLFEAVDMLNKQDGGSEITIPEPPPPAYTEVQFEQLATAIKKDIPYTVYSLSKLDSSVWIALHRAYVNTAPRGEKGHYREVINQAVEDGRIIVESTAKELENRMGADDQPGAVELLEGIDMEHLQPLLPHEVILWIDQIQEAA